MPKTMILAIGGAGGNILEAIQDKVTTGRLKDAVYVFTDSDSDHISALKERGHECIVVENESEVFPRECFDGIDSLIVIAGLGGKTSGMILHKAIAAAEANSIQKIVAVATMPFSFEGKERVSRAKEVLSQLSVNDKVKTEVFRNDDMVKRYPDLTFVDAFARSDNEILRMIASNFS